MNSGAGLQLHTHVTSYWDIVPVQVLGGPTVTTRKKLKGSQKHVHYTDLFPNTRRFSSGSILNLGSFGGERKRREGGYAAAKLNL